MLTIMKICEPSMGQLHRNSHINPNRKYDATTEYHRSSNATNVIKCRSPEPGESSGIIIIAQFIIPVYNTAACNIVSSVYNYC